MSAQRQILVFASWYATKKYPQHGVFFQEQALALAEFGHAVFIVGIGKKEQKKNLLVNLLFQLSLLCWPYRASRQRGQKGSLQEIVLIPPALPKVRSLWNLHFFLLAWWLKFTAGRKFDLLHLQSMIGYPQCGEKVAAVLRCPIVVTEHLTDFIDGSISEQMVNKLRKRVSKFSLVSAVGHQLQQDVKRWLGVEVEHTPNLVDIDFFTLAAEPLSLSLPLEQGKFRFAAVCFLAEYKNLPLLLESFAQCFQGKEELELVIGGDGPEREALEVLARQLGVESQVVFLGNLKREQVRELYWACDVVVSSSRVESFGVTLIEAMACGKPVLATRSGGPETFVTAQTGLLVEHVKWLTITSQ